MGILAIIIDVCDWLTRIYITMREKKVENWYPGTVIVFDVTHFMYMYYFI
jgi:hypothetical protein